MSIFDEKRTELERHEFMMGVERGRLAVALDLLTDSLILVGQHGVYCASSRNPAKPALDLQSVLGGIEGAKALIQSVMEELRAQKDAERMRDECDQITEMNHAQWLALENCKSIAARNRKEEWSQHILRFCADGGVVPNPLRFSIKLNKAEIQSGVSRVRWAEGLIRQLPEDHEGRNSWLLNYSDAAIKAQGDAK